MRIQWYGPGSSMGLGQAQTALSPLRRDAAWMATVGGLAAYLVWQCLALVAGALILLGRNGERCIVGPECSVLAGSSDLVAGLVAGSAMLVSLAIIPWLGKLLVALWQGRIWTTVVLRVVGNATAVAGLLGFLIGGWIWFILGLWISFFARRMRSEPQTPRPTRPAGGQPYTMDAERV